MRLCSGYELLLFPAPMQDAANPRLREVLGAVHVRALCPQVVSASEANAPSQRTQKPLIKTSISK